MNHEEFSVAIKEANGDADKMLAAATARIVTLEKNVAEVCKDVSEVVDLLYRCKSEQALYYLESRGYGVEIGE